MLIALHIENFAIVKYLELDLSQGMTAFTGETGAGKSIMIDALMLALGERTEASVVRLGAEKCTISATFQFTHDSQPALWLKAHDLYSEGEDLILRRVVYKEGRSKSYINGQPYPLQKVKALSELLVHIHGQHQHQTLMIPATHRQQLDLFAKNHEQLEKVSFLYQKCNEIKQELEALEQEDNKDKIALLEFQLDELLELQVEDNEIEELYREHQLLHHAQDYLAYAENIGSILHGEDGFSVMQGLNQIAHTLHALPKEQKNIQNVLELIESARIQCEEAQTEIAQFSNQVQLDPARLQEVEKRMGLLHQMARKYHVDANCLKPLIEQLQREGIEFKEKEKRVIELQKQHELATKTYEKEALLLRELRLKAVPKLGDAITQCIQQLGMPKGYIEIEWTPLDKMQAHGLDKIEYKACTNPGTTPDSLFKIASGGELSRISLAIQMITAQRGCTPTLFFDEVDVGIGGATAALVGQMLRKLGQRLQVFCVTHQPQVAASAHHHFVVEKHSDTNQTYTNMVCLIKPEEKVDEIARMLSGLTTTEQTRSHAKELLEQQCCHV